ncbi:MAG: DNA internalization-related competence protein ComEC/Rec2 [Acidobacteriota bacterium]|nr:DNA internalization-related competence protein ComEC/Rec2 [Acidobacteriota bacterium]
MRDIFSAAFILALAVLFLVYWPSPEPQVFRVLALAIFALFLALFLLKKHRAAYACIALALALLLAGSYLHRREAFEDNRDLRFPPGEYVTIRGRLAAYPEIGGDRSWLLLRARSFSWRGKTLDRAMNVRVACSGDLRRLRRSDFVEVAARVDARQPNRNVFPNPYENFLLYRNIQLSAYSKAAQLLQVTGRANVFWRAIGAWRERVRRAIEERYLVNGALQPAGVFLEATILGDRGRLENGEQEALIGSGVFHLLAISGANIALLAMVSLLLCRWLRFSLRLRYGITALLLILFLAVSGFDVSAERAVLMALLVFAGRVWFMDIEPSNIISFCGLLLLAVNPAQFLDPGFILTFALTAAILIGRRIFMPMLKALPRWASELVSANFSAALMALPLSLHFFQRYAFSGFFSGLLLAPLAAAITICGVLLLLLAWLPPGVAALALLPAGVCLDAFFAVSNWIYEHASLSVFRPAPPLWLLLPIGLSFFAISLDKLKVRWRSVAALLLAGMLAFISLPPRRYRPQNLEVYFLDVGHGDSEVAVFPDGDALLVDGGGSSFSDFQVGRRLVLPFLIQKRIHVRWAAVSHFHPDHARGMSEIIGVLKPEELWLSSAASEDEYYRQLLAAKPGETALRRIQRGFVRNSGVCSIACLAPPRFIDCLQSDNDHSMVLRVSDGRAAFLLGGDIGRSVEAELASVFGPGLASSVLKLPHHGSRTSASATFLESVNPRLAVISVPSYSSYGFPHREVSDRLKHHGIPWLTTARSGGIRIASRSDGLEIDVSK